MKFFSLQKRMLIHIHFNGVYFDSWFTIAISIQFLICRCTAWMWLGPVMDNTRNPLPYCRLWMVQTRHNVEQVNDAYKSGAKVHGRNTINRNVHVWKWSMYRTPPESSKQVFYSDIIIPNDWKLNTRNFRCLHYSLTGLVAGIPTIHRCNLWLRLLVASCQINRCTVAQIISRQLPN